MTGSYSITNTQQTIPKRFQYIQLNAMHRFNWLEFMLHCILQVITQQPLHG